MVVMQDIEKSYGAVKALDRASFEVEAGKVAVLLGANGSGKSTLSKILGGSVRKDRGRIEIDGEEFEPSGPEDSREKRIAVVYQELSLIPSLSVGDNIVLGSPALKRRFFHDKNRVEDMVRSYLQLFEGVVDPGRFVTGAPVDSLPPDEQQLVEILKALFREPSVLILDEATASLRKQQVERLFELVRDLCGQGKAVIFISHRMDEIYAVGDEATVLRNGKTVARLPLPDTDRDRFVRAMTGEEILAEEADRSAHREDVDRESVLSVRDLTSDTLKSVSFELGNGEILGIGGLQGQGQGDLIRCLIGAEPDFRGEISLNGGRAVFRHPGSAIRRGLTFISGDRKREAVFSQRSILENLSLVSVLLRRAFGFTRRALAKDASPVSDRLALVFHNFDSLISSLSGGNQQKVIIGRALLAGPRIILMDDPTKGIDVNTKAEFYRLLRELTKENISIIWNSSEDRELLENADRVLVMHEGRISGILSGGNLNAVELYKAALA